MSNDDCIFCRIISRMAPASIVYEDELALALLDIQPMNPGHLLVVPKRHVAALAQLDAVTSGRLLPVAVELAGAIRRSGIAVDGINVLVNDGSAAGQIVEHVHLHVVPRLEGDQIRIHAGVNKNSVSREQLESWAYQIKQQITGL